MKIAGESFQHNKEGWVIEVTTCNSRLVTTLNKATGITTKFNRAKFEWMINNNIFKLITEGV